MWKKDPEEMLEVLSQLINRKGTVHRLYTGDKTKTKNTLIRELTKFDVFKVSFLKDKFDVFF